MESHLTCVAYMRCSGASQLEGDTWSRQIEAIRSCCESKGISIVEAYKEEAVSGKLGEEERPAFQQMVADLLGNGCRTVVIESLDRLARQYDVQQQLATYLASKQLTLISANTGEDITAALMGDPMRRALVQIQGIFAELDKNLLIAKLAKARHRKKEKTGKGTGRHAFGEKASEALALEQIRKWRSTGAAAKQIAADLTACGYQSRSGKPWRGTTVAKIIRRFEAAPHAVYGGRDQSPDGDSL